MKTTYYAFNSENVKSYIETLTSDKYDGRLTGSIGNNLAAEMIENKFKDFNLDSFNNSYKNSFTVNVPCKNYQPAELIIKKSAKVIQQFKYGTDFKEDFVNFKTSSVTLDNISNIDVFVDSFIITQDNHKYLFKVHNDFNFRSSFNINSSYDFCIAVKPELYDEILAALRDNCTLTVNLPYTIECKSTANIIGVIKGYSKSLPPVILTAHYDHLGSDALNHLYAGALDNASGTAFILELSKNLSSTIRPKRDIIFIAFTGEEIGLLGSKNFVKGNYDTIKDSAVINFDMIGSKSNSLVLMNGKNSAESDVSQDLEKICSNKHITYNMAFQNSSDHASFSSKGINAVTICHADFSRIHTPEDTVKYINTDSINTVYSIVQNEIFNYAYNSYELIFYNTKVLICVSLIFITLIITPLITSHKKINNR